MREIYFRGKDLDGNWREGDLIWATLGQGQKPMILDAFDEIDIGNNLYEVAPETVGQFTGMLDCEGCKIYEGDVVLVSEDGEESKHEVRYMDDQDYPAFDLIPSSVRWCYESNGLSYCMVGYDANIEIRVVGNIHDNPELLEQRP